jgi:hypothetical protein
MEMLYQMSYTPGASAFRMSTAMPFRQSRRCRLYAIAGASLALGSIYSIRDFVVRGGIKRAFHSLFQASSRALTQRPALVHAFITSAAVVESQRIQHDVLLRQACYICDEFMPAEHLYRQPDIKLPDIVLHGPVGSVVCLHTPATYSHCYTAQVAFPK